MADDKGLEARLTVLLEETLNKYDFISILLTNGRGLPIASCGEIRHEGIAAIAPEFVKLGDSAVRLGSYESVTCVALLLENRHMLIIKEFMIGEEKFILALDTRAIPPGLKNVLSTLAEQVEMHFRKDAA